MVDRVRDELGRFLPTSGYPYSALEPWRLLALLNQELAVFADALEARFGPPAVCRVGTVMGHGLVWRTSTDPSKHVRLYRLYADRPARMHVPWAKPSFFNVNAAPPLAMLLEGIPDR